MTNYQDNITAIKITLTYYHSQHTIPVPILRAERMEPTLHNSHIPHSGGSHPCYAAPQHALHGRGRGGTEEWKGKSQGWGDRSLKGKTPQCSHHLWLLAHVAVQGGGVGAAAISMDGGGGESGDAPPSSCGTGEV